MYVSTWPTYGTFHTLVYIVNKMSRHVSLTLTATYDKVYHVKVHLAQKFLDYYLANQVRKIVKFRYFEKAAKFCEISNLDLTVCIKRQI